MNKFRIHQPNFLQNIQCIFFLIDNNTNIGLCYLDPQEIPELAMIFGLKVLTMVMFYLWDAMVITTCKNNVINIYYKIDTPNTRVTIKN